MLKRKTDFNQPHPYVRYGRMSDPGQNERSPDQQFAQIERELRSLGYPWMLLRDFRDDGISGRLLHKRLGFQQMLREIKTGVIRPKFIACDTFERFGRAEESAPIRAELQNRYGVLVVTADSRLVDPTTVAGQALAFVEGYRAVEDGRVKAHNVLRGKLDSVLQRHWPGGPPPLGYKIEVVFQDRNGRPERVYSVLVPDPESAWVVVLLFETARDKGWGCPRLAQFLNENPQIPGKFKPFGHERVRYILSHRIYYGEYVWNTHATGIVGDHRVMEANPESDWIRVPDFCQGLVPRELWEKAQVARRARSENLARMREGSGAGVPAPALVPAGPARGMTLRYPLSGLVRCGDCGRSMHATTSGAAARPGTSRYTYYACQASASRACGNTRYVREPWLREAVVAKLRARLFPPPTAGEGLPGWLPELLDEVRREYERLTPDRENRRPAIQAEMARLRDQVKGWMQSLGNPNLPSAVRATLEAEYGQADERVRQLEAALIELDASAKRLTTVLEPARVLARLHRIAEVLAADNPTAANIELAHHIDRIECCRDGTVVLKTARLGVLEGSVELLARPEAETERDGTGGGGSSRTIRITPRLRGRPAVEHGAGPDEAGPHAEGFVPTDPMRFAGLEDKWFWKDPLEMPRLLSWAERNAAEVARLRAGDGTRRGMTHEELAAHFRKTVPTVRNALAIAGKLDKVVAGLPRRLPRRRWAEDNAEEVKAAKVAEPALTLKQLSARFGKSEPIIRAALQHAARGAGSVVSEAGDAGRAPSEVSDSSSAAG